ncbi:hypothetical protein CGCF413_v006349 [Colletotrichum fructicola]|nr:hypothetical protein CGCF413_v006349 [Colletotrichum fructicola]
MASSCAQPAAWPGTLHRAGRRRLRLVNPQIPESRWQRQNPIFGPLRNSGAIAPTPGKKLVSEPSHAAEAQARWFNRKLASLGAITG